MSRAAHILLVEDRRMEVERAFDYLFGRGEFGDRVSYDGFMTVVREVHACWLGLNLPPSD